MDLYRLNLNLLVALDTMLAEKSVTLAAKKLSITQAAMSNNLQQLREIFKDDLLIREKNHMVLSVYARDLQPKLHQVIEELRSLVVSGQCFVPASSERMFKIGMSDYMASLTLPTLSKKLEQQAPKIKLTVVSALHIGGVQEFEDGGYDLAVGKIFEEHNSVRKQLLFKSRAVCVLHPEHPLAKKEKISMEDYLAYQHVAICSNSPFSPSLIEEALMKLGVKRNIKIGVPYIGSIFQLISESCKLIGTAVEKTAKLYQPQYGFIIKELPFAMDAVEFYMIWHQRSDNDAGHIWLRDQLIKTCS